MGTPSFLMDQEKGEYNKKLLEKLGITDKSIPPIFDKGKNIAKLNFKCYNL